MRRRIQIGIFLVAAALIFSGLHCQSIASSQKMFCGMQAMSCCCESIKQSCSCDIKADSTTSDSVEYLAQFGLQAGKFQNTEPLAAKVVQSFRYVPRQTISLLSKLNKIRFSRIFVSKKDFV